MIFSLFSSLQVTASSFQMERTGTCRYSHLTIETNGNIQKNCTFSGAKMLHRRAYYFHFNWIKMHLLCAILHNVMNKFDANYLHSNYFASINEFYGPSASAHSWCTKRFSVAFSLMKFIVRKISTNLIKGSTLNSEEWKRSVATSMDSAHVIQTNERAHFSKILTSRFHAKNAKSRQLTLELLDFIYYSIKYHKMVCNHFKSTFMLTAALFWMG